MELNPDHCTHSNLIDSTRLTQLNVMKAVNNESGRINKSTTSESLQKPSIR